MFTRTELRTLTTARAILQKKRDAAQTDAIKLMVEKVERKSYDDADAFDWGLLAHSCEQARDAIFDVMNIAANHTKDALAKKHLHDK